MAKVFQLRDISLASMALLVTGSLQYSFQASLLQRPTAIMSCSEYEDLHISLLTPAGRVA